MESGLVESAAVAAGRAAGAAVEACKTVEEAMEAGRQVGLGSQQSVDLAAESGQVGQSGTRLATVFNEAAIEALDIGLDTPEAVRAGTVAFEASQEAIAAGTDANVQRRRHGSFWGCRRP